jgi:hypothetical protein
VAGEVTTLVPMETAERRNAEHALSLGSTAMRSLLDSTIGTTGHALEAGASSAG